MQPLYLFIENKPVRAN